VGQFGLTVSLEGGLIGLLGESKGVEDSDRGEGTWDIINRELKRGGLLGGSSRGKGSGGTDKGKEGGSELHGDDVFGNLD
jgi:hypothetical protein